MGIGDWGLGIGDWAQSPIPNPQSPFYFLIMYLIIYNIYIKNKTINIINLRKYNIIIEYYFELLLREYQ